MTACSEADLPTITLVLNDAPSKGGFSQKVNLHATIEVEGQIHCNTCILLTPLKNICVINLSEYHNLNNYTMYIVDRRTRNTERLLFSIH
jgi:hypothetical protein